jgi:hypothetical protein
MIYTVILHHCMFSRVGVWYVAANRHREEVLHHELLLVALSSCSSAILHYK